VRRLHLYHGTAATVTDRFPSVGRVAIAGDGIGRRGGCIGNRRRAQWASLWDGGVHAPRIRPPDQNWLASYETDEPVSSKFGAVTNGICGAR
jgi:hypothetical protein